MNTLFHHLHRRIDRNASRAVEVYQRELADYRTLEGHGGQTTMLEFAVVLRRRTIALATDDQPFSADDLRYMETVGEERGERGVSLAAQRHVLTLHSTLTLQEMHEATGPQDIDDMMRLLRWLGPQGLAAQDAYTRGYLAGQRRRLPFTTQVQQLAAMLVADDPAARVLAQALRLPLPDRLLVMVTRIHGGGRRFPRKVRAQTVDALFRAHRTPMSWSEPGEFIAVAPVDGVPTDPSSPAETPMLALLRDLATATGQPCSIGAATGGLNALAQPTALARRISQLAPAQRRPERLHTLPDMFVELGVTQVPAVDAWLHDLVDRLSAGPDLITTLDAFYRHDMNRLHTAAALHIHPRTLDYRLGRARDVTGLHPASTHGVRVLSTVVTLHSAANAVPPGEGRRVGDVPPLAQSSTGCASQGPTSVAG